MATPITVNQSTTLVQIDTSVFANAPHIVLLSNLNSPGSLITIRDTFGAASPSNTILISTTNGVSFLDGGGALSNLYTINQPYGFLTVTPKTSNIWGVTNTFAFPDSSQVANLNAINVSSMNISTIGYIQSAHISTAGISTICTNNLFITANMSVGQSTIAHAGFFVCSIRTLDDFIASSNIYAGSTISSLFGNITSTLTVPYISTTDVWMNGVLQTASTISTNGPLFVGSSISTTGNLAVGASTFIQGQLTVLQAAFFASSISTTGALNVGYETILHSSLQVAHNALIGGNVSTLSNMTVAGSVSVMSSLYTQWDINANSSILAHGSFSTLQDVNIGRNLSTLGKAFIGQELYTTSSILVKGAISTLQDVNVASNVSILGNLYVKGVIQFDQIEVDLQDIMASSIITQYNISSMSTLIAGGGLYVTQSTFLGGTVSSLSNFNIAGLLSTASTVVVGDSLNVAKTGFFGSNISTPASMGVGANLRVGGGAVLQSTLSTFGQAAFFSSVQIQGSMSVMSSIAAACNVFVGHTLSTSNLILYGSTSISTLAVTNTIGFGLNVSSSTLHYGLFSTSGAMNIGGRISTTNALIVGSTIDTQYLNVQKGMSVFSNAGFAQDVFARSSLVVGMSTILNGGFYTEKSAYMADVQFTKDVVIGNDGGLQPNFGNLNNFGTTTLKGDVTVTNGTVRLANSLQIGNDYGNRNLISNDTWMSSLTASSLVVSYYQSTIGNAAFFSSVQVQGGMSVFSTLNVEWNANMTRNLAASTICTNQLTISTLNVIAPSNTSLFVSSSTLHYGLFSSFGQIFTGKEISTMGSLAVGGNFNLLSNAEIGRNLSTLGTAGFGTTVNILGTTTGQGTAFFNTSLVTPQIFNSSLQTSSILTSTLTAVNTSASNMFAISTLIQSNLYVPFINNSSLQTSSIMTSTMMASNISTSNIFASNAGMSSIMASTINVSTLSTVNLNASSIGAPMAAFSTMSVFSQAVISNVFARAIGVNCNTPQFAVDVAGIVNASQIYQNGSQYVPLISNLAFSSISTNYALIRNMNVPSYFVAVTLAVSATNGGIYTGATPATLAAVTPTFSSGAPTSFSALYYTGSVWYLGASNATNSFLYRATTPTTWTTVTPVTGALPSRSINCIAFNGEYYLLAGSDAAGNIVRTTDFSTFTSSPVSATFVANTLVWNNSIWVAGGSLGASGYIVYSPNGSSWTAATTTFINVFSIVWNGTTFVAIGNDTTTSVNLKYSFDAITWTNSTVPSYISIRAANTNTTILSWSGKVFVAVLAADYTSAGRIFWSRNGITWTQSATTPVCPSSVTWDGVKFVLLCGTNGATTSTTNNIFTSPDGSTWTALNTSMRCVPIINFTTNTTPTLDVGNTSFYTNAQPQFQGNQSTNTVTMLSNAIVLNNLYTDNLGNVGIRNNAPAFNLDVAGSINFTGTINSNGSPLNLNTAGINSAGNVGINGTANASYALTVSGSQSNTGSLYAGVSPIVNNILTTLVPPLVLSNPYGICIDSTGTNVYIADTVANRIRRVVIATGVVSIVASASFFNYTYGICIDPTGTNLYFTEANGTKISKIVIATGISSVIAGDSYNQVFSPAFRDGTGTDARFLFPTGICIDPTGTNLYVADTGNKRIRKIVIATGEVTTIAGSGIVGSVDATGTGASFRSPIGICIDPLGTNLYVTDSEGNHKIRKITIPGAVVTTFAGAGTAGYADGTGIAASFNNPTAICIDSSGLNLYVSDTDNNRIRKIVVGTGVVTTFAGSGVGGPTSSDGAALLSPIPAPRGICVDFTGSILYVNESGTNKVRKIGTTTVPSLTVGTNVGINTTTPQYNLDVAGNINFSGSLFNNGTPFTSGGGANPTTVVGYSTPYFSNLDSITADTSGNIYVADNTIGIIRKLTNGFMTTIAGAGSFGIAHADGTRFAAVFNNIAKIAYDSFTQSLIIADAPNIVCALKLSTGVVTTFVNALNGVTSVCADGSGNYYISDSAYIYKVTPTNTSTITVPTIIAGSATLGYLNSFRGTSAKFRYISGLSLNAAKTILYIADGNNVVRQLTLTSPFAVATVAGRLPALTDSTAFTNSSISGIQLWFDGRDPGANGAAITPGVMSSWADKSGNGRNATAANSPNIASNGEVRFASNSHFTTNYIFNTRAETGFAVVLLPGTRGDRTSFTILELGTNTPTTTGRELVILNDGNGINAMAIAYYPTGVYNTTFSIPENVPVLLSYTLTSTTLCYYVNGTQISQFTGSYTFGTSGNTTIGNGLGGRVSFSLFELILYNRVLPEAQRQQVEAYLIGKWNCATPAYLPPSLAAASTRVSATSGTITLASSSISGLQLWLDGADPANGSVPAAGAAVATWADKSGNGRNATGVASPTFTAGGGISFNGSSQYYSTSYTAVPTTETAFIVVSFSSLGAEQELISGSGGGGRQLSYINSGSYNNSLSLAGIFSGGSTILRSSSISLITNQKIIISFTVSSTKQTIFINGLSIASGTPATYYSGTSTTNIGSYGSGSQVLHGVVYEVLLFNTILSDVNRFAIENYLNAKWSVYVPNQLKLWLDSSDPYANSRPAAPNASISRWADKSANKNDAGSLVLWLDACDVNATGIPLPSSDTVGTWRDKSGYGYDAVGATTVFSGTTYPRYSINNHNNLPVVQLEGNVGTASSYFRASIPPGTFINEIHVFVVYKWSNATTGTPRPTLFSRNNSIRETNGANPIDLVKISNGNTTSSLGIGNNNAAIKSVPYDIMNTTFSMLSLQVSQASQTVTMHTNGTELALGAAIGGPWRQSDIGDFFTIGSRGDLSTCFNGSFGEIMVFNTNVTGNQRIYLEGYLASKWGLQTALPTSHAYYTNKNFGSPRLGPIVSTTRPNSLMVWLDGADPLGTGTAPSSGAAVPTWYDKSGYGNNGSAIGTPPTFSSGIVFSGANYYSLPDFAFPYGDSAYTYIIVSAPTSITGNKGILGGGVDMTPNGVTAIRYQGDSFSTYWYNNDTGSIVKAVANATSIYTSAFTPTNSIRLYVNGKTDTIRAPYNPFSTTARKQPPLNNSVGRTVHAGGPEYMNGTIQEILVFNYELPTAQRQIVEGYLARKWSVTLAAGSVAANSIPPSIVATANLNIPGANSLQLWVDGSDPYGTGVAPPENTNIGILIDKSGNGNHLAQPLTANQPIFNLGATQFNTGSPVVAKSMNIPITVLNNSRAYTLFLAFAPNQATNIILARQHDNVDSTNFLTMTNFVNSSGAYVTGVSNKLYWHPSNSATNLVSANTYTIFTKYIVSLVYDGATTTLYQNGVLDATLAGVQNISNDFAPSYFVLGAGVSTNFNLYSMMVYNTALTTPQRQTVEGYLSQRYSAYLATSHPYYYSPPLSQPIWAPTPIQASGLSFDGASQYLVSPLPSVPTSESGFFVITAPLVSGDLMGPTANSPFPSSGTTVQAAFTLNGREISINNQRFFSGVCNAGQGTGDMTYSLTATSINILSYTYSTATGTIAYLNGRSIGSDSIIKNYINAGQTLLGSYMTGSGQPAGFFGGSVYEIMMFNTAMSDTNRKAVEAYLAAKWNVQLNALVIDDIGPVARFNTLGGIAADSNNNLYVGDSNLLRYVDIESPFSATSIPGLQVWLDGADPLGTGISPANGTVITTWSDKSGLGRNATSVGSPLFNTSSNAIVLNGNQAFSLQYPGVHPTETTFMVVNMTTPNSFAFFIETGISYARQFYNYFNTLQLGQTNIGGNASSPTLLTASSNTLLGYTMNSTESFFYFNGVPGATGTGLTSLPSETTLYIGYSGTGNYLVGTISEVLIYNEVLTTAQRQLVERYLASKWNITMPTAPYIGTSVTQIIAGNGTASNVAGVGSNTSLKSPLDVALLNGTPFITAGTSLFSYNPTSGYLTTSLQSTGNSNQVNLNASSNVSTISVPGITTTTIFGSGFNTINTNVSYSSLFGIACDSNNTLYVGDGFNIRSINSNGVVTTVVGQPNNASGIITTGAQGLIGGLIYGICLDGSGNIYFTNSGYNTLSKYTVSTGVVSILLSGSPLSNPRKLVYDGTRYIYLANYAGTNANGQGNVIRYDTIANTHTVFGSNSPGFTPSGVVSIAINPEKTLVFIGDNNNLMIWVLIISTGGIGSFVSLPIRPYAMVCDSLGNIYVCQGTRVFKTRILYPPAGGIVGSASVLFATTTATDVLAMITDTNNNLYLTDGSTSRVLRITQNAVVSAYSGNGLSGKNDSSYISSLTIIGQINAPQGFSGSIGINCNAPQHALDVTGVVHTNTSFRSDGELIVGNPFQAAYLRTTVQGGATYIQSGTALESLSVAPLFFTGMYGGPMLMALTATGLGIGTSAPAYKLDVIGDINFSGNLRQNGVIFSGGGGSGNLAITGSVTNAAFAFGQTAGVNASLGNVLIGSNASGHGVIQTNGSQNGFLIGGITAGGTVQIWLNNLQVDCNATISGNILTPGVVTAQANMIIGTGLLASQARAKLHIRGGAVVGQASGTMNHIAFESESAGYNHYITTTHAASSSSLNAIHFWLNNTTQAVATTAGTGNVNTMSVTGVGAIVRADVPYASVDSFANLFANAQLVVKQISADSCLYLANGNTTNAGSGSVIQSSSGGSSGTGTNLGINPFGGSVGIGTNSPGYTLDVAGRINASNDVNIGFTGAGFMRFTTAGGATYIQSSTTPLTGTGAATGNFAPIYFTGMAGAENKMALTNTGLGIGTTTPEYKLDVAGTTRLNGVVRFQSDVYHKSLDGIDRLYFQQNGITYFKSGDGSFRFQNSTSTLDVVSIDNDGNVGARGAINSTSNLTAVNGHFNVFNSNITGYVGSSGIIYGRGAYSTVAHVVGNTRGYIVADYGFLNDQWNFVFNAYTNNAAWAIDNGSLGTSRIAMQSGVITFLFGDIGQAPTSTRFTFLSNGRLGVNCNAPGYNIDVNGDANINGGTNINGNLKMYASSGFIYDQNNLYRFAWYAANDTFFNTKSPHYFYFQCGGSTVSQIDNVGNYSRTSDKRIKKNIVSVKDSLDIVNKLNICSFDFVDNIPQSKKSVKHGFIAQEVFEVYPEATSYFKGFLPTANCIAQTLLVDSTVKITTPVPHQFIISDTIEIIIGENRKQLSIVSIISDTEFTVSVWNDYDANKDIIVFGKKTEEMLSIDPSQFGILATGACQILSQQNDNLQSQVSTLQNENSSLQAQVASQQSTINAILAKLNM